MGAVVLPAGARRAPLLVIGGVAVAVMAVASSLLLDAQVIGSVAGVLGTAVTCLGVWPQARRILRQRASSRAVSGSARQSVAAPVGNAPTTLHGRQAELSRLRAALARPSGRFTVLAGLGGVGKSALALALHAHAAGRRGRHTWWISARTPETFTEGLVVVAEFLGAGTAADADSIRAGAGRARDRFWELLSQARRGWLLIIDDADDISVLGALDGTGWLRPSRRGLVLVTSRVSSTHLWGHAADVIEVGPLADGPAARMLLDLADVGSEPQARSLAQHLGGLPLALKLAGSNLGWEFSRWDSFSAYERALESMDVADVLDMDGALGGVPDPRQAVMTTFELSLDSLRGAGLPQATPLLRMLSCYAPGLPIPVSLLETDAVYRLLDSPPGSADGRRHLYAALRGLARLSLVNERHLERDGVRTKAVSLHPLVSETNRSHLRRGGNATTVRTPHQVSADVVVTALEPLRSDDSRTWPLAAILIPHVRQQLATSTAYLGEEHLARLLEAAARLVAAAAWSGAAGDSEQLAIDALACTGPLGDDHVSRLNLRTELAWATGRNGRWEAAHTMLTSVLDVWMTQADPPLLNVLDVRHKLAWSIGKTGNWALAHTQLAAVCALRRRMLGGDHPDTLHTRCCLSWAMWRTGLRAEAEVGYREVIADRRAVLGDDHIEVVDAYHSLAEGYVLDGYHVEAEQLLRAVIADRDRILGPEHPETLDSRPRYWLGRALQGQGRDSEAADVFASLLKKQATMLGADHPATVDTRTLLAGATADL